MDKQNLEGKRKVDTFQSPTSRPYFLVTSSAEDGAEDLISSVFSFTALSLKLVL